MRNMSERLVIIAGGDVPSPRVFREIVSRGQSVVAVDGGVENLLGLGMFPDLVIGDLDSISEKGKKQIQKNGVEIQQHPSRKNKSDLEIAMEEAVKKNYDEILILGACGKRVDHTLFNLMLLFRFVNCRPTIRIFGKTEEIFAASGRTILRETKGTVVSLVPFSERVTAVKLKGFRYELNGEDLLSGTSRGLSNVVEKTPATIEFENGKLLVIINRTRDEG